MRGGLRVGELARRAGVSAPTLRFYERAGLLAPPERTATGYPPEAVADLRFIVRAKMLGLSLEQIRVLRAQPSAPVQHRQLRHLLAHHLAEPSGLSRGDTPFAQVDGGSCRVGL